MTHSSAAGKAHVWNQPVDLNTATNFQQWLLSLESANSEICIDLSQAGRFDSAGIACILSCMASIAAKNQRLTINHLPKSASDLAEFYGVSEQINSNSAS